MDDENQVLASELTRNLASLIDGRDDALRQLGKTQVALHSVLRREAVRQRARGREDRARALEARAGSSLAVIERLETERQRLRILVPDVSEKQMLIHGRVRDPAGRGLAGLTACLVDAKNNALPGIPSPITDGNGYYALVLGPTDRKGERPRAYLAIFSATGRLLHREKQALELAAGTRVVVDVTLDPREAVGRDDPKRGRPQPPRGATPVTTPRGPRRGPLDAIVGAVTKDPAFSDIGISADKLLRGLSRLGVDSVEGLSELLQRGDRELRDGLRLPSADAARAFKRILQGALGPE